MKYTLEKGKFGDQIYFNDKAITVDELLKVLNDKPLTITNFDYNLFDKLANQFIKETETSKKTSIGY